MIISYQNREIQEYKGKLYVQGYTQYTHIPMKHKYYTLNIEKTYRNEKILKVKNLKVT